MGPSSYKNNNLLYQKSGNALQDYGYTHKYGQRDKSDDVNLAAFGSQYEQPESPLLRDLIKS